MNETLKEKILDGLKKGSLLGRGLAGFAAFHHILGALGQLLFVLKLYAGLFDGFLHIDGEGIKILLHFLIKIACHL